MPADRTCAICGRPLAAEVASDRCSNCSLSVAETVQDANQGTIIIAPTESGLLGPIIRKQDLPRRGFGDYEFLNQGNQGGMGIVYQAHQKSLNRTVALKMIRAGSLASARDLQRFRREAEAAASLDHPHIVPIYEVGEHQGTQYFTMKWIDGQSASQEFGNAAATTAQSRIAIANLMLKVCRAVQHAHERGILHRDLKPGNILVDKQGEPHVTDFGLAKRLEAAGELTVSGEVMGTPSYMSPEQASGNTKETTTSSDVYGLGAILYRLFTGRAPFVGQSGFEIVQQVLTQEPPRPTSLNPGLDKDLETICLKCLQKEPQDRYSSARAIADDLLNWLSGKPIAARPVGDWVRAWKWVRRHAVVSALSAAVLLSLLIGLAGVLWQSQRAERQRAISTAAKVARQMQRAEDFFETDKSHLALATLARLVRDNPKERVAAERLINSLDQRVYLAPVIHPHPVRLSSLDSSMHGNLRVQRTGSKSDSFRVEQLSEAGSWLVMTQVQAHTGPIRKISFSSNGDQFVTASADGSAKVWDRTGRLLFTLPHAAPVGWAEFSPDGRRIITVSDGVGHLWDAATRLELPCSIRHVKMVNSASFSPDGSIIVTASDDQTIRLWDGRDGQAAIPIGEPARLSGPVDEARFSEDGSHLAATNVETGLGWTFMPTHGLLLSEADPLQLPTPFSSLPTDAVLDKYKRALAARHSDEITCVDISDRQDLVATSSLDKSARIWDARTLQPIGEPLVHDAPVNCVCFSLDGLRIVTSTARPTQVRIWDTRTSQPLTESIRSKDPISAVRFGSNGRAILCRVATPEASGWRIDIHPLSAAAPAWLPELAERIATVQYTSEGLLQPVSTAGLADFAQQLLASSHSNHLAGWAHSLLTGTPPSPLN